MAEHLTFKGIPIDGDPEEISKQLQEQGFIQNEIYPSGSIFLTGTFAAVNDCMLLIHNSKFGKTTWAITILFPIQNNWFSLKEQYKQFKDMFIKKYGHPKDDFCFFTPPYEEGDGDELSALESENATYMSVFHTDLGFISVNIDKSCCLKITYEDKLNSDLDTKQQEAVAYDDI